VGWSDYNKKISNYLVYYTNNSFFNFFVHSIKKQLSANTVMDYLIEEKGYKK